ncbi:MAG: dihydrofolate reductase [Lactobacillus sp.]|nr:dihydrofolate reductase [Lactobacillus sp.]
MLTFVWAEDKNHAIGYQGKLPWSLPADMKHFRKITATDPMIMGRKTFASLPKLLANRQHIVLTRDHAFAQKYANHDQVKVFTGLENLRDFIKNYHDRLTAIGGVSIFENLIDLADVLEKTEIDAEFSADTYMPEIDYSKFELVAKQSFAKDEKNLYDYTFKTFRKK